jgi:shikimate dehydrogenase
VSASTSITPRTDLCGIVLHPAGHTRSPALHNAAFRALGLDAVYLAFDVPPEALGAAIAGARALGVRQLAVSIPHKQAVMEHLDVVDETARAIGAVNTVTRTTDGRLAGSNTDWLGVVRTLEKHRSLDGAAAVVLGAGGTARASVYGLVARGARVTVLNRTESRAAALAEELGAAASGGLPGLADLEHDVLVNTTSVGLGDDASPVPAHALRPDSLVLDAVYEPERTRLLRDAEARGALPISGRWMLIHQAAEQLRLWTGKEPPLDVMAEAFGSRP